MSRCRADSFYLSPGDKREFAQWSLYAVLPDGTRIPIEHRGDVRRIQLSHPSWDGRTVAVDKTDPTNVQYTVVDAGSIEGKPFIDPKPALLMALSQGRIENHTAKSIATTFFGAPKEGGNATSPIVKAVGHTITTAPSAASVSEIFAFTSAASSFLDPDRLHALLTHCAAFNSIAWCTPDVKQLSAVFEILQNYPPAKRLELLKDLWTTSHQEGWWDIENPADADIDYDPFWDRDDYDLYDDYDDYGDLFEFDFYTGGSFRGIPLPPLVSADQDVAQMWEQWHAGLDTYASKAHLLTDESFVNWCRNLYDSQTLELLSVNWAKLSDIQVNALYSHILAAGNLYEGGDWVMLAAHPQLSEIAHTPAGHNLGVVLYSKAFQHAPPPDLPLELADELCQNATKFDIVDELPYFVSHFPDLAKTYLPTFNAQAIIQVLTASQAQSFDFLAEVDLSVYLSKLTSTNRVQLAQTVRHPAVLSWLTQDQSAEVKASAYSNYRASFSVDAALWVIDNYYTSKHQNSEALRRSIEFLSSTSNLNVLTAAQLTNLAQWAKPDTSPYRIYQSVATTLCAAKIAKLTHDRTLIDAVAKQAISDRAYDAIAVLAEDLDEKTLASLTRDKDPHVMLAAARTASLPAYMRPRGPLMEFVDKTSQWPEHIDLPSKPTSWADLLPPQGTGQQTYRAAAQAPVWAQGELESDQGLAAEPVTSNAELRKNAAFMGNCTYGYRDRLLDGSEVMYKITDSQTGEVYNAHYYQYDHGTWHTGEVNSRHNKGAVPNHVHQAAQEILTALDATDFTEVTLGEQVPQLYQQLDEEELVPTRRRKHRRGRRGSGKNKTTPRVR